MKKSELLKKILSFGMLVLLLAPMNFAFSQNDDDEDEEKKIAALKANAQELIRETSTMAQTLASPNNRINFSIKSADILWNLDETDARAMFTATTDDVKRLIGQLDVETNQQQTSTSRNWSARSSSGALRTKTTQVFTLRRATVNSLANHDPEWAMRFMQETGQMFTNQTLVKRVEREDKRLEAQIIRKLAAKDVSKALELGREKLAKGVTSEVVSLASQIYSKDKEKGAAFAKDILGKLNSSTLKINSTWLLVRLFNYGLSFADAKENPLFDKSAMSELADLLAKQVTSSSSRYRNLSSSVMKGLEQYAPNSAAQVKRTFEQRTTSRNSSRRNTERDARSASRRKMWEDRSKFQKEIVEDFNKLNDKNLSNEDRLKIINEAKSKIMSVEDENYRLRNLIGLASRIASIGEKEVAGLILGDAELLINQDPKNKEDFANNRGLANAYALIDSDKSFNIWENMVYRLNGVINGYIKFMEFSRRGTIVENDELIINSQGRQFSTYLRFSPSSLKALAENDFDRLKDLLDKFERPEMRVELRLTVAKALLNAGKQNKFNGSTIKRN